MYALVVEAHNLIRVKLSGVLSTDEADALVADFRRRAETLAASFGSYRTLLDLSSSPVQTQLVVELFARFANSGGRSARIFLITPSALARMQMKRIISHNKLMCFGSADDADLWLAANPGTE
jgi:hypothetical protein